MTKNTNYVRILKSFIYLKNKSSLICTPKLKNIYNFSTDDNVCEVFMKFIQNTAIWFIWKAIRIQNILYYLHDEVVAISIETVLVGTPKPKSNSSGTGSVTAGSVAKVSGWDWELWDPQPSGYNCAYYKNFIYYFLAKPKYNNF